MLNASAPASWYMPGHDALLTKSLLVAHRGYRQACMYVCPEAWQGRQHVLQQQALGEALPQAAAMRAGQAPTFMTDTIGSASSLRMPTTDMTCEQ